MINGPAGRHTHGCPLVAGTCQERSREGCAFTEESPEGERGARLGAKGKRQEGGRPLDRRVVESRGPESSPIPMAHVPMHGGCTVARDVFPLPSFYGGVHLDKGAVCRKVLRRLQKQDQVFLWLRNVSCR